MRNSRTIVHERVEKVVLIHKEGNSAVRLKVCLHEDKVPVRWGNPPIQQDDVVEVGGD